MVSTPKRVLKLGRLTIAQLLTYARSLAAKMSGNPNYASPVQPTLLEFADLITDVEDAIIARGTKQNAGGAVPTAVLEATTKALKDGIIGMENYIANTTPYDKTALLSSGAPLKKLKHISRQLQTVRSLVVRVSRDTNLNETKIDWKRALGGLNSKTSRIWKIVFGTTPAFSQGVVNRQTTATQVIINHNDLPSAGLTFGQNIYFWVVGQNGKGESVISNLIVAKYTPLS